MLAQRRFIGDWAKRDVFFDEPISEEMVSRYKHMPYFLTKWIGEELSMTYHYQYGVPTTVFRFATVIEPGEFLNEDGLPRLFLFNPVYERYKDATGDDEDEQEMIETIKSLWTGEEKFLISLNPNGRPYKQEFTDCPGYCSRIGFRDRKGKGGWRGIHAWRCSVVPMGRGGPVSC